MDLPNEVLEEWPHADYSPEDMLADLQRSREAGGSSPAAEVKLNDGRLVRIELPYDSDELVVTDIDRPDDEVPAVESPAV